MQYRLILAALTALALLACGAKEASAPAPAATALPEVPASAPTEAAPAEGAPTEAAPAEGAPTEAAPAEAAAAPAEDWLIWVRDGEGWRTRWVEVRGESAEVVAARRALLLSDGQRLWRIQRKDARSDVKSCDCLEAEEEDPATCRIIETLVSPGLEAVQLPGGEVSVVSQAEGEATYGSGIYRSLNPVGGVGGRLFLEWTDSGYYCGAHGNADGGFTVFDLGKGKRVDAPLDGVAKALPRAALESAAKEILPLVRDCDDDAEITVETVIGERMGLNAVSVRLAAGQPELTWHFSAEVMYACSADYASHGAARTGLVPAGASLGLAEALPKALLAQLTPPAKAQALGWSEVNLSGEARAALLSAFRASEEPVWPPSTSESKVVEVPKGSAEKAGPLVRDGRRLTRAGTYPEAIAAFDAALALDPSRANAWSGRGYARLLAGQLDAARDDFDRALTLDTSPRFQAAVWTNLAQLATRQGDEARASAARAKVEALKKPATP